MIRIQGKLAFYNRRLADGGDGSCANRRRRGGVPESPSIDFYEDSVPRLVEHMLASAVQHQREQNAEQSEVVRQNWTACKDVSNLEDRIQQMTKRGSFPDKFKATVALEALRSDKTVQEIAAKHKVYLFPATHAKHV